MENVLNEEDRRREDEKRADEKKIEEEKIREDKKKEDDKKREEEKKEQERKKEKENEDDEKEKEQEKEKEEEKKREKVVTKIGSGKDLPITQQLNSDDDSFTPNGDRAKYRHEKKDRVGGDDLNASPGDEKYVQEPSGDEGSEKQKDEKSSNDIYARYKRNVNTIDFHFVMQKISLTKTDVIKGAMRARLYVNASGVMIAARRHASATYVKKMTDDERRAIRASFSQLYRKGKIKPDEFTDDIQGHVKLKGVLDKEVLRQTGMDLSKKSTNEIIDILRKNGMKIDGKGAFMVTNQKEAFAYTSYALQEQIELLEKVKRAEKSQNMSLIRIGDELMGHEMDFWNGTRQVRRIWNSPKRVRKIIRIVKKVKKLVFSQQSTPHNPAPRKTEQPKTPPKPETPPNPNSLKKPISKQPPSRSKLSVKVSNKISKLKEKAVQMAQKFSRTATISTGAGAGAGASAASAGASAGTAAGGVSLGVVAGIVVGVMALAVLLIGVILVCAGTISGGFMGDKTNASDNSPNGEGQTSILYICCDNLNRHDEYLLQILQDGVNEEDVDNFSLTLYDDLTKFDTVGYRNPITSAVLATGPAYNDEGNVILNCYDAYGNRLPSFRSNAKDILCATTVLIGNDYDGSPQTAKRYAENLWYDTHTVNATWITNEDGSLLVKSCKFAECSAVFTVEERYAYSEDLVEDGGIITTHRYIQFLKDENGDAIDDLRYSTYVTYPDMTGHDTIEDTSLKTELVEKMKKGTLFGYQSIDGEVWTPFTDFLNGYSYKFCAGHAEYELGVTINFLNDNTENPFNSSLFDQDSFTYNPSEADFWNGKENEFFSSTFGDMEDGSCFTKLTEDTVWDGNDFVTYKKGVFNKDTERIQWSEWTDENKEMALHFYEDDWYELYGISFSTSGSGGSVMEDSEIGNLAGKAEGEIAEILEFALGTVGRIPYYWGGKQTVSEIYINHQDMSPASFLSTYYPHLGTQKVSTAYGNPVSVNGWYGCGGIDSKRNIIGLDCSGWVSFVYNNFGISVGAGTGGLSATGTAVSYYDLKPGDLLIDHSSNAHVVMFVCWDNEEKTSYTTVECAGSSGVIAKSGVTKKWEYYRRVID